MARDTVEKVIAIKQWFRDHNLLVVLIENVNERGCDCGYYSFVMGHRDRYVYDSMDAGRRHTLGALCNVEELSETAALTMLHIYFGHEEMDTEPHEMRDGLLLHVKV